MSDADVYFYNGLNLEGGENGWAARMAESVGLDDDKVVDTRDGVEPMYLTDDESEHSINTHAFLDPNAGMTKAENGTHGVSDVGPETADARQASSSTPTATVA